MTTTLTGPATPATPAAAGTLARPERLPQVAATASLACLIAHVALLVVTRGSLLSMTLPMLVLSSFCGACSLRSWRRRFTDLELAVMLCTGLAMVAVHLLLAPMHGSGPHVAVSTTADLLMHGGLSLALMVELVAGGVLVRRLCHPTART
ncbi:hypothetical protein [Nocardioides sp. CER19]|uniref:hypothetical protein n=1 Tax=Nocardioides sp. CER19 TaxID=3038538 RepID=UPI00244A2138|nr:hypothetical protein [Nocardioides sp. CER19]MDH2414366.1 hypothetical protein [Nocardioides sp. CER19]